MRSRRLALALCIALLVATSLVPGAVAVTDAGGGVTTTSSPGDATRSISVRGDGAVATSQESNATVALDRSIVTVRGGESTTIELAFQGTDEATVVVGGDGAGDNVTATVTDSNGDGVVPLEFDSSPIGTMATRLYPVDDGDDYGTVNASEYGGPLPAGEYPISVYVGHGVSGEPTDVGTLVVNGTTTEPPEDTTPHTTTALPDAFIDHSGDAVTLHARAGQTIRGTADLDAGGKLMVWLESSGDSSFRLSREATVGPDGEFATSFDLSEVEAPADATAVVTFDGDRIAGPVDVVVVDVQTATSEPETSSPGQGGFGVWVTVFAVSVALTVWRWRD